MNPVCASIDLVYLPNFHAFILSIDLPYDFTLRLLIAPFVAFR